MVLTITDLQVTGDPTSLGDDWEYDPQDLNSGSGLPAAYLASRRDSSKQTNPITLVMFTGSASGTKGERLPGNPDLNAGKPGAAPSYLEVYRQAEFDPGIVSIRVVSAIKGVGRITNSSFFAARGGVVNDTLAGMGIDNGAIKLGLQCLNAKSNEGKPIRTFTLHSIKAGRDMDVEFWLQGGKYGPVLGDTYPVKANRPFPVNLTLPFLAENEYHGSGEIGDQSTVKFYLREKSGQKYWASGLLNSGGGGPYEFGDDQLSGTFHFDPPSS